ncbi:uncharacterized protein LOC143853954 [Tasmannia lanceolata]|uniref:uncharacterized protein LOC143853954 n=1 Tax=Tasmannia lanceolata TaxID=3420 RepID=UPI00406482FE
MALAAVLIREEHNQQKPIYYVSKVLHDAETRYQRVKKLAYALVMAARKLRPEIKAQVLADFVAECTIPQKSISSETIKTLVVEDITIPGGQVEAEAATSVRTEGTTIPAEHDMLSEALWEVYVDGSSSRSGCGASLILTGLENFVLDYALRFGFRASNNEAEYEALITGMNLAVQTRAQRLKAYCDSQLVTNQIQGVYEARYERMIKYLTKVRLLASKFKSFEVIRIPRMENTKADVLSKLAASGYTALGSICMEFLKKSSIDNEAIEIMQVDHEPSWIDEIIDYLRSGKLLKEKNAARKVIQRAARFSLDGENLYKRSCTLPYLKCLRPSDAAYTLQETHEGICGEYLGGQGPTNQSAFKRPVLAHLEERRFGPG